MAQPNDDDCVSKGGEREDRHADTKIRFESVNLDIRCPDTAILLLGSRERPVLVAAASALTKFAAKGKENLKKLFELEIVDSLIPLVSHEDLFTRRFAARLLGEMAAIEFVRNYLLESEIHLPYFTKMLVEDSDIFMKEYASLILAEISEDPRGTVKLLDHCSSFDFIFANFKTPDPDVKKNNAQIINNLLKDLTGADRVIASQGFSFTSICQLLEEAYPEIQNLALSVLESLVSRNKDDRIQRLFRESGALTSMLDILDNSEFADLHSHTLRVLSRALENPMTVESLISGGGISKLFRYFEGSMDPRNARNIFDALVHLGTTASGREALYNIGMVKHILRQLHGPFEDQETIRIACIGIGQLSRYEAASAEIAQENPVKKILDVLKDENLKWPVRDAASFALKELCTSDKKNCQHFLDVKGPTYLEWLLQQTSVNVSFETAITALDILTFIGGYPDFRKILLEVALVDSLCASFKANDKAADELKIASCRALSNFCVDKRAREFCIDRNLVKKLFNLLSDIESTPVRAAAVQLVQQLSRDPAFAQEFLQAGYLTYMLKNRSVSTSVPTWNTCIEALFSAHLPTKFAATGRISMHETTKDGFYVMRRQICPFPMLDELFRRKMCPVEPIYVANFDDHRSSVIQNNSQSSSAVKVARASSMDSGAWLERNYGKLQKDSYLQDYLELFHCILAANESLETTEESGGRIVNISKMASRAKLLANFVARKMSGPNPRNPCIDHQLEIHIREIQEDTRTSVIPLGRLRVGSYLERAVLFKVLADRIFLPTSLVRGDYNKAWNEISIPEIENPAEDSTLSCLPEVFDENFNTEGQSLPSMRQGTAQKSFNPDETDQHPPDKIHVAHDNLKIVLPKVLLQENYIVDLMENPGDLIPINSRKARTYCGGMARCVMSCED